MSQSLLTPSVIPTSRSGSYSFQQTHQGKRERGELKKLSHLSSCPRRVIAQGSVCVESRKNVLAFCKNNCERSDLWLSLPGPPPPLQHLFTKLHGLIPSKRALRKGDGSPERPLTSTSHLALYQSLISSAKSCWVSNKVIKCEFQT